jgi:hypothetical protein
MLEAEVDRGGMAGREFEEREVGEERGEGGDGRAE